MKKMYTSAFVVIAAFALAGCGQSTFNAKGTVTVTGSVTAASSQADPECHGTGGYDDMDEGAQVKVTVDGKTVGTGSLERGVSIDQNYGCKFAFTVADVPGGSKFYSVEVSHRGALEYKEEDLKSGVSLQLGK